MSNNAKACRRWQIAVCAALAFAASAGCSSGTYPVRGKLLYKDNGEPVKELAGFTVTFTSESVHKSAYGTIQEDGTFRLMSLRPDDGALPGVYKVVITQPHPMPDRPERRLPVVDEDYENPSKTPLTAEVEAKSQNEFTFSLERIKPKPKAKKG